MKPLTKLPTFRAFKSKADAFLEELLLKARARQADKLRKFMATTQHAIAIHYPHIEPGDIAHNQTLRVLSSLRDYLERQAFHDSLDMTRIWGLLRHRVYAFSYASTHRAIINVGAQERDDKRLLQKQVNPKTTLGDPHNRILISLYRIVDKVIDSLKLSIMTGDDQATAIAKAMKAFPMPERVKKQVVLRRLKEAANDDIPDELLDGPQFITPEEWEDILKEYETEFVPEWRDPRKGELDEPVYFGEDGDKIVYGWQLENEMVEDFVQSVSDGEVEAANQAGITQFVWIAILDKKTDECCKWRDGLTNTEIKDMLANERADDECRATVPPAHFRCRCRAAPATDDLPDRPDDGAEQFEGWLNS